MSDKIFHITFESISDFIEQARKSMRGSVDKKNIGRSASFKDFNQFMDFMFPQKFTILVAIKMHKPKSLYEIAKITNLPQSSVLKECNALESSGFITLKEEGSRSAKVPELTFDYNEIRVHADFGDCTHTFPKKAA
jgi:predicted transcriptional regulator